VNQVCGGIKRVVILAAVQCVIVRRKEPIYGIYAPLQSKIEPMARPGQPSDLVAPTDPLTAVSTGCQIVVEPSRDHQPLLYRLLS